MDKIRYTITAYIPGTVCNLRCDYCYISKCVDEKHLEKGFYRYSVNHMIEAFNPKRFNGIASITVIGAGETLVDEKVIPFIHGLLKHGHVVEVVTNLTLNDRIMELVSIPKKYLKRLIVKGSLHWIELKRLNKINDFFDNMKKIIDAGASSYPFLVCNDIYVPYFEEIRNVCLNKISALPHCTPSFKFQEKRDISAGGRVETSPKCTKDFVEKINKLFNSKIFNLAVDWIDIKPNDIFCYAGKWSFCVNIGTGSIFKCHNCPYEGNFFKNIKKMPNLIAIGKNCRISSCALQYNFISQGLIPEKNFLNTFSNILSYGREHLFNKEVLELLNFKYTDFKKIYTNKQKLLTNIKVKIIFSLKINISYVKIFVLKIPGGIYLKNKLKEKILSKWQKY